MLLDVCGDGAEAGFIAAGGHQELVEVEQLGGAFTSRAALLAVAQQLVDSLGNRFLDARRLALDHGQAVEKEHHIGQDVMLCAGDAHLELADGDELVVGQLAEVHVAHCGAFLAGGVVDGDAGVLQQQTQDVLVVFDQAGAGRGGDPAQRPFQHRSSTT